MRSGYQGSAAKRQALAVQYGKDGYALLEAVRAPGALSWLRELPAVQVLRRVWVQQYYRVADERGEQVIRREASGMASAGQVPDLLPV